MYLRPSRDQVAGDLLERRALHRRRCQGSTGQTVDERMLPRRRANKSQPSRCDIFPTGRVVSVLWRLGAWQGNKRSSARPGTRRRCRKVGEGKGTKQRERVVVKRRGDKCVFILEGPSWQMRPGRAVRAVTGPLPNLPAAAFANCRRDEPMTLAPGSPLTTPVLT